MRQVLVEWSRVEDYCIRAGWILGWTVGVLVGVVGFASGGSPELAALRAGMGLVGFVLLGWITGVMIGRMAPTSERPRTSVGTRVDLRVGNDVVWPETAIAAGTAARGTNAA